MKKILFLSGVLFFQNCIADITTTPEEWSLTKEKPDKVIQSEDLTKKMTVEIIMDPSSTVDLAVYQCETTLSQGITTNKPYIIKHDDSTPYLCRASYHSIELTTPLPLDKLPADFSIKGKLIKHYE